MARSLDDIFGSTQSEPKTLDQIFAPPAPVQEPLPSLPRMMSAHEPTTEPFKPSLKTAFISGTLNSLAGKALTPIAEKITGRKVDLSTLPAPETLGQKAVSLGSNLVSDLPLWLAGDALLAKPLGALAKTTPISKVTNAIPKALTPALGTGVRAGITYGLPINALETAVDGDGLEGFVQRAKEAPLMALGGTALHGAGQLVGKGVREGIDYAKFNKLTKIPETQSNPLETVREAYKPTNTLRDARATQLNKTFADTSNNLGRTGPTLPQQGLNPSEMFQVKRQNAQDAFGGPLKSYKVNTDTQKAIAEISSRMEGKVKDIVDSLKQADSQTRIETIRKQVKDMGGISPANDGIFEERRIIPNWIKNNNGRPLDEVADTLGMTSDDLLKAIDDSAYKPRDFESEAYSIAYMDPEYQALNRTLDALSEQLPGKKSLQSLPQLKTRESPMPKQVEQSISAKLPVPQERLTWTNKDNLPSAGPAPLRSITSENLRQLPNSQTRVIEQPSMETPRNNQGFAQEVIEPSRSIRLQTFNDSIPELPNTASHIVSRTERQPINTETLRTNAYIKTTDNLHRLNQLDKYIEDATGQKLSPQDRTYMLALNSRGTGSISSHILEERLVNSKGEAIGESLKTITSQLKNKNVAKEFDDYLVNKHAITRMRQGEKVFPDEMQMTPGMSEAKVREYEAIHPEFRDLSDKLYEFQNKLSKAWLVDTGIVSPEAWGKWITENPHYVPNNRLFSELEKTPFSGSKRGFAGQTNPVKARTGSQRQIISPLESIMEHVDQYVKVAKRNEVMQSLIRNLKKNPEEFKGWAEVIPDNKQLKQGFMDDINQVLEKDGIDGVVEQFNRQFDDIFNAKKQRLDLGNVVTGLVDGEKVHVKVNDPLLLDALTNLKPQAQQIVIAALGRVTSAMKNLTTGINPMFGLARNIWRDIPTAFINSKSTNNPLVFGRDLLGSIIDIAGNKELYKSYKAMGGGYASSSVSSSRNTLAESKARLLPGYALKHPFKTALGGLERLNNTVETAPRLAEFKRLSKPGDYSSRIKGLYEANDVTTNFSRTGNIVKEADSIMPYLNAAWQGIDKLRRTFTDNPIQASAKALAAVTFPTIMLYQLNHNNPAYQQLSDYIKDNNFLIPRSDGTFLKVPKPREIGVIFGSSVERSLRKWQDSDPDAFNRFMETVKTNFTPPTRSILAPLNDVRSNKDFMDRPIVSGSVSRLSPHLQFDEKTSEPAKFLGKTLNQSPQNIDYLAKSYLGGIAQIGIPATTKNASVGGTLKRQITADPVFSNDVLNDFYTTKSRIDTSASDSKATGDKSLEVGQQYKKLFTKTNDKLSDIRKDIDKIQASNLAEEEKEARIRAYQIQMLRLAKEANDRFKIK